MLSEVGGTEGDVATPWYALSVVEGVHAHLHLQAIGSDFMIQILRGRCATVVCTPRKTSSVPT